jgi:hypothetical protein
MKERDKSPREEHLQIRNFGPIHEADITIRDLTIFVGPQATGKSLAAQALYFLRRVEKLLLDNSATPLESTLSALEWWLGNDPLIYAIPGTPLCWSSPSETEKIAQIQWKATDDVQISKALEWGKGRAPWRVTTLGLTALPPWSKDRAHFPAF